MKTVIQEATTLGTCLFHCTKATSSLQKGRQYCFANSKLEEVMKEAEYHFALEEGSVNKETVWSRVKRFNLDGKYFGDILPIKEFEKYVKFYALALAHIGSLLKQDEIIQLANDIILANPDQNNRIIMWKKKNVQRSKGQ